MASRLRSESHIGEFARLIERATQEGEPIAASKREVVTPATRSTLPESKRTFLDTNILLYAEDGRETRRREIAIQLIVDHRRRRSGVVSLQVLQEFFANATRKLGLDPAFARRKTEFHSRFDVVEPSISDIFAAIDLHRLHQINYWDAMIVHCAKQAGCHEVLTEDMHCGQVINGVRIVNPFI